MIERRLIDHCSPTLAGLKTGSLFSCPDSEDGELEGYLDAASGELNGKNVYLEVLRRSGGRALIYVYRKSRLERELRDTRTQGLLSALGYKSVHTVDCIERLRQRIILGESFPHEIGVFLGYPINDVVGFIENEGRNFKYTGFWKVYGDVYEAVRLFGKYKKCRDIYTRLFLGGRTISQLTVAA